MKILKKNFVAPFLIATVAVALNAAGALGQDKIMKPSSPSATNAKKSSNQILQERIARESAGAVKMQPIEEALSAVQETRSAAQMLEQNDPTRAKMALERAVGKLDVVLANHPDVAAVPITVDIKITDMNADDAAISRIVSDAKAFMAQGQYQAARLLLRDLASEVDVAVTNLPLGTYPAVIREASGLIEKGKTAEARAQLLGALNSLAIVETAIPLPVIRAQALVDEVAWQVQEKKFNKTQAGTLLKDADRQLALAEKLGYGGRKDDFNDLHASIKTLQADINHDRNSNSLLADVKADLQSLKEHLVKSTASR